MAPVSRAEGKNSLQAAEKQVEWQISWLEKFLCKYLLILVPAITNGIDNMDNLKGISEKLKSQRVECKTRKCETKSYAYGSRSGWRAVCEAKFVASDRNLAIIRRKYLKVIFDQGREFTMQCKFEEKSKDDRLFCVSKKCAQRTKKIYQVKNRPAVDKAKNLLLKFDQFSVEVKASTYLLNSLRPFPFF